MPLTLEQRCARLESSKRWYHKARREIIARLGGHCCMCESTEGLEIHHKEPLNHSPKQNGSYRGQRSGAARVREWKDPDAPKKLELRCYDHHQRW